MGRQEQGAAGTSSGVGIFFYYSKEYPSRAIAAATPTRSVRTWAISVSEFTSGWR